MRRKITFLLISTMMLLACRLFSENAQTPTTIPIIDTPTLIPPTVFLTMDAQPNGSILTISGETDLPDGAWLVYEINHENFINDFTSPFETIFAEGKTQVTGGKYSANLDMTIWQPGVIEIWLAFQMFVDADTKQPQELIERFGEFGELMIGDNVTPSETLPRVELQSTVEWQP